MSDVSLVADGGEMTVARRVASHVWGEWSFTAPEGATVEEMDERVKPGYSARLPAAGGGRFDRAFVRADADVDARNETSNVEESLVAASRRVEGNVLFERDITAAGLGAFMPGRDFRVGDIVDVVIWGRKLPVMVTAAAMVSERGQPTGWRVHVGGSLIADKAQLSRRNDDVNRQIKDDRAKFAERLKRAEERAVKRSNAHTDGEVAPVRETADAAQEKAKEAEESAVEANTRAIEAHEIAITNLQRTALLVGTQTDIFAPRYPDRQPWAEGLESSGSRWSGYPLYGVEKRHQAISVASAPEGAKQSVVDWRIKSYIVEFETVALEAGATVKITCDSSTSDLPIDYSSLGIGGDTLAAVSVPAGRHRWRGRVTFSRGTWDINIREVIVMSDDGAGKPKWRAVAVSRIRIIPDLPSTPEVTGATFIGADSGVVVSNTLGVSMPSMDRYLTVYARPSFVGSIYIQANYANGDNYTFMADADGMNSRNADEVSNHYSKDLAEGGQIKYWTEKLPLGTVASALLIYKYV